MTQPPHEAGPAPPCRCGHGALWHVHYRPGDDCSICGPLSCVGYRPDRPSISPGLRRLLLVALAGAVIAGALIAAGLWLGDRAVYAVLALLVLAGGTAAWMRADRPDRKEDGR